MRARTDLATVDSGGCASWLGSGGRFDSDGLVVAGLLIVAPLFFNFMHGVKNRLSGTRDSTKGVVRMHKALNWLGATLTNIGCGLAGGILSQAKAHSHHL